MPRGLAVAAVTAATLAIPGVVRLLTFQVIALAIDADGLAGALST